MLDILRSEEEGTVRIIALGPRKSEIPGVEMRSSAFPLPILFPIHFSLLL